MAFNSLAPFCLAAEDRALDNWDPCVSKQFKVLFETFHRGHGLRWGILRVGLWSSIFWLTRSQSFWGVLSRSVPWISKFCKNRCKNGPWAAPRSQSSPPWFAHMQNGSCSTVSTVLRVFRKSGLVDQVLLRYFVQSFLLQPVQTEVQLWNITVMCVFGHGLDTCCPVNPFPSHLKKSVSKKVSLWLRHQLFFHLCSLDARPANQDTIFHNASSQWLMTYWVNYPFNYFYCGCCLSQSCHQFCWSLHFFQGGHSCILVRWKKLTVQINTFQTHLGAQLKFVLTIKPYSACNLCLRLATTVPWLSEQQRIVSKQTVNKI